MNISLTPRLDELIKEKVSSGMYNNASEVVREALRMMERNDSQYQTQLEEIRAAVREGIDSGEPLPFNADDIKTRGREILAKKQKDT